MNSSVANARPDSASRAFQLAVVVSLAAHAAAIAWLFAHPIHPSPEHRRAQQFMVVAVRPLAPIETEPLARPSVRAPAHRPIARARKLASTPVVANAKPDASTSAPHQPASMDAPPPPSAEAWALAASYKLKNSKRYRNAWGVQVRSLMGTAVEGPDQGEVRFRVEIAPDGTLARLDTLWSTSQAAERLARAALGRMPPLPPTPTGKPLIFEKTIAFQPRDTGWPPIYRDDCLPDAVGFRNPYAWNGTGQMTSAVVRPGDESDQQTSAAIDEACRQSLPADSVEAVAASVDRQFKTWGSLPLNGVK